MTDLERFLAKTTRNGECLDFIGTHDREGYGRFWMRGRTYRAHRASLILHGRDPGPALVLHLCNRPACVKPEHLRAGTQAENIRQALREHRRDHVRPPVLRGARNPSTKLTPEQVGQIRAAYVPRRMSAARLAREFGVSTATVKEIIARKIWRDVA